MKRILGLFAVALATNSASALHYFNCSSADQKLSITEREVWGANPVGCTYEGQSLTSVILLKDSAVLIDENRGQDPRDWDKTFVITAAIGAAEETAAGIPILCHEVSTPQLDLKERPRPCKVELK